MVAAARGAVAQNRPGHGVLLKVWTNIGGTSTEEMFGTAKLRSPRNAAIALLNLLSQHDRVSNNGSGRRDEMGSSVEGLKLRRMRIRNEISFNRSTEGRTEWAEDLEALREELRRVSKQIEEAEQ